MRIKFTLRLALLLPFVAAGCFSDPGDEPTLPTPDPPGSTTPGGTTPGSTTPGTTPGSTKPALQAAAEETHLGELDRIVGQYASGDSPVYDGTVGARGNGVMSAGPVVASLVKRDDVYWTNGQTTGHVLTMISMAQQRRFRVSQIPEFPGLTRVDMVVPFNSSFGVYASCHDCMPDLGAHPARLSFAFTANGKYGDNSPLVIDGWGELGQILPEHLTFEHIRAVNQLYDGRLVEAVRAFALRDGEWVRTVKGAYSEDAPRPPSVAYERCTKTTTYQVEQWIDAEELSSYGIRGLEVLSTRTCCMDDTFLGCGPAPGVCFDE